LIVLFFVFCNSKSRINEFIVKTIKNFGPIIVHGEPSVSPKFLESRI